MARPASGSIKKGKKNRKHGRNKKFCERYRAEGREAKNKALNIERERRRQKK